ncbi:type I 3-dehydroquinate dehydratase [Phragmitibacter flavus]|uniref:3-dehydroquinate dehydratase n=1 Tax=Phragmitibacter flavus TaxID=2576071 RepID=A0A5R8KKD1_9BACT|nr:type I 3-dehydroquinate dehydratase [Phragmitibacter flavus]TLD72783.1 type I 3-dehydroquinate dehydratase [Phragmitibacter flavus]
MPQLVSSKNLLFSNQPLVVGVINTRQLLEEFAKTADPHKSCDLLELRLDTLNLAPEELRPLAARLPLPLLLTARHPEEGGDHHLSADQRREMLHSCLDLATLIDIELRSAIDMQDLIRDAQTRGVGVIGSFHDFPSPPADEVLQGSIDFALQFKFDAVKIATTLQSPADLARLIQLLPNATRRPLCLMGMGGLGPLSRLTLGRCGSLLNYGFLGAPNAPGQLSAPRLREWLNEI